MKRNTKSILVQQKTYVTVRGQHSGKI